MPAIKTEARPELGWFLRRRREEWGLTQNEMAQRITESGYTATGESLSRWERTGIVPVMKEPKHADMVANAYKVPVSTLLKLGGVQPRMSGHEDIPLDLLSLLDEATPEQMQLITRLVRAVVRGSE